MDWTNLLFVSAKLSSSHRGIAKYTKPVILIDVACGVSFFLNHQHKNQSNTVLPSSHLFVCEQLLKVTSPLQINHYQASHHHNSMYQWSTVLCRSVFLSDALEIVPQLITNQNEPILATYVKVNIAKWLKSNLIHFLSCNIAKFEIVAMWSSVCFVHKYNLIVDSSVFLWNF